MCSIEALADHAETMGLKGRAGGRRGKSVIRSLLRNPRYAGRLRWGRRQFAGNDLALTRWELCERVEGRPDGHPYTRGRERTSAYTGMISCGHRSSAITAEIKKARDICRHCSRKFRNEEAIPEATLSEMLLSGIELLRMSERFQAAVKETQRDSRAEIEREVNGWISPATARMERLGRLIDSA